MPVSKSTKESKAAPTLRYWVVKLKEIQSSFGDIWEFVETFQEDVSPTQISVRLNAIDDLWERFGDVLIEIKSHEEFSAGDEIYDKERKEFSDRYYHAKSFLIEKAKERQEAAEINQTVRSESGHMANVDHVRLPQIKLQSFDGNIDEWLGFRDLYLSLIHWKQELPEVEKFHYLKGCLQGEPKALIDPLQITRTNYAVAWEMLLKRYNNSKQLKKRQVQSLFKLPGMVKESKGELQTLLEGFERIVHTLDQVLQTDEYKDLLLVNFLVSRLDSVTRRSWEEESATKEQDSLAELTEFLHRRVRVLEALPPRFTENKSMQPQGPGKQKTVSVRTYHNNVKSSGFRCPACKDSHLLHQCQKFLRMDVNERDSLLKIQSLCRNCFRSGHMAKDCQSKFWCRTCKGRHHTLVCFKMKGDSQPAILQTSGPSTSRRDSSKESSTFQTSHVSTACLTSSDLRRSRSQVLLATAVVFIEDEMGTRYPARALLDSGSESNFISERLCQLMEIKRKKVDISILGIGQVQTRVRHKIEAVVHSRVTKFSKEMNFLILPKVTVDLPTSSVDTDGWRIPDGISLADPSFFVSTKVDLVLGIEFFFEFFQTGKNMLIGDNLPTLTESVFGWVVSGGLSEHTVTRVNCNTSTTESLESLVSRFWACEEIGLEKLYTEEEQMCEDHFQKTVLRNSDGRYTVALPKNPQSFPTLGESKEIAFRRLQATERRLNRDSDLQDQYTAFMEEYLELGHMQRVSANLHVKRCFLPHHPVLKESSTTTKLRVVFDASCRTSSGTSLNDGLLAGPVIQEDLRSIILRCRTKQVMVVADVEKMFRQIFIAPEDRPLQSILWRKSVLDEVAVYELNTVTYGTKPAPFLATRTLKQLAIDEQLRYPLAAKAFTEDTYMDDVITGAEDVEAALELRLQLENAATAGGFRLRKFASNCPRILEGMADENVAIKDFSEDAESDPSMKILGLTWLPKSDIFKYQFRFPELSASGELTKRQVLSVIATLFDPLGLLGAAITTAKVFMQQLWLLQDSNEERLGWDQPLPPTVGEVWRNYYKQLPLLNEISIARCVRIQGATSLEIHCFSDASEKAYGGCVYLKSVDSEGRVMSHLLSAKSKVAPLKSQSIPRLELCGALLTVQLFDMVQKSVKIDCPVYFWTDSTCVLRWIQAVPTTWTTYVANRVAKIQLFSNGGEWKHVPGADNPADLISRGISPSEIGQNQLWWHGPDWLVGEKEGWPILPEGYQQGNVDAERRRQTVLLKDQKHQETVERECCSEGIRWHFNPPSAPHFGGLWEAAVRSAKQHILKVIGENPVSAEDFTTLLVQVEACLNSRPLTPLSDNPEDLEPLTPGHFLIGESLQALPDVNFEDTPDNRLNQLQQMQKNLRIIWNRWRREYLAQLQARTKRWKPAVSIKKDSLVIIKDVRLPPCRWKMGRISELHPGSDGVVRVVTLRTDSGMKTRPVEKLCLLPCVENEPTAEEVCQKDFQSKAPDEKTV
ncbi:uncharacterized protein LOC129750595 [Uranotaenia lowii]|uniref:uncharacterized protein LOC129750595 n=1 Tax=Uranotaenia lowii TaxID=190385 RepID=UPI00247A9513|nr:uncharacterized protein LOC129750595 [Uranotaenia lowii]